MEVKGTSAKSANKDPVKDSKGDKKDPIKDSMKGGKKPGGQFKDSEGSKKNPTKGGNKSGKITEKRPHSKPTTPVDVKEGNINNCDCANKFAGVVCERCTFRNAVCDNVCVEKCCGKTDVVSTHTMLTTLSECCIVYRYLLYRIFSHVFLLHVPLVQTKQQTHDKKTRSDTDTKPTEKPTSDFEWWKNDGGDVGSMSYPDKKSTKNKKRSKKQKTNMRPHKIAGVGEGVYGKHYANLFGGVRI
jgi:hypothetical protein